MATAGDLRANNAERFNDPFVLTSSQYIPEKFDDLLSMCEYLAAQFPSYTQTARRTVSHFLTELQFYGDEGDEDERKEMEEYMITRLQLMEKLQQAGLEYFIFGNSFVRMYYPFERFLVDRRNGTYREYNVNEFGEFARYVNDEMTYDVPDPDSPDDVPLSERPRVRFAFRDRSVKDASRIRIMFIEPRRMILRKNHVSGKMEYIWKLDQFFVDDVRQGTKIWQVNDTPKDILKAIRNNEDYRFADDRIFHLANTFISGVSYNGWGIPGILLNYHSIHQTAVYRRINEAVGLDFLLPIRVLSPAAQAGSGTDAAAAMNLGPWTDRMKSLVANKRKDPEAMHVVPFPIQYQELGGNGKALAPVELLRYANDQMLEDFGFPAELHHMSLQSGEVPTAIRMFQSNFIQLQHALSKMTQWVATNVRAYLGLSNLKVKLAQPTMADDLERRNVMLQLAAGGEVTRQLAYRLFGVDDATEEMRRRTREDLEIQRMQGEEQAKFEREQQMGSGDQVLQAQLQAQQEAAAAQGGPGGPAPGGPMPAPGGDGMGGRTPDKVMADAEQLAMQWLQMQGQDDRAKSQSMEQVRNSDPTLYAVAKQKMEEMRAQGASEGRRMAGKQ